jgi:hypothetical protein
MASPPSRERTAFKNISIFIGIHPSNKPYVGDGVLDIP